MKKGDLVTLNPIKYNWWGGSTGMIYSTIPDTEEPDRFSILKVQWTNGKRTGHLPPDLVSLPEYRRLASKFRELQEKQK
jgi:hypothetical protein